MSKAKSKKLKELYYEPINTEKPFMIVEDMVPVGLTMLAGLPKIGKSWMVLQLGEAIAEGKEFMGKKTNECGVLYLCLDDAEPRLQKRVAGTGEEPNDNFNYSMEAKTIETGLFAELNAELEEHPEIRVVIIDTMQKVRDYDGRSTNFSMYAKDDKEITALKQYAYRKNIAIILVHHATKEEVGDNPLKAIQGSNGVIGGMDSILFLDRKTGCTEGSLFVIPRDAAEYKVNLQFKDTVWSMVSIESAEEVFEKSVPDVLKRIADFVKEKGTWKGTLTELCEAVDEMEMKPNKVAGAITEFYDSFFKSNGITFETIRKSANRFRVWKYEPPEEKVTEKMAAAETEMPESIIADEPETEEPHDIRTLEWLEGRDTALSILGRPPAS